MSRLLVATVMTVLVLGACGYYAYFYTRPAPQPSASLDFTVEFPGSVSLAKPTEAYVYVTNNGGPAKSVIVLIESDAVTAASEKADLRYGGPFPIKITLTAMDVQDGLHTSKIRLQYSDESGTHETEPKQVSFYVVPYTNLIDIRWQPDILHPFGKNMIGKKESTILNFKVQSKSKSVIYYGLWSKPNLSMTVPGLFISPARIEVGSIGPAGKTGDYAFTITSNNAPPCMYKINLYLCSKDGQLIAQETVELVVGG